MPTGHSDQARVQAGPSSKTKAWAVSGSTGAIPGLDASVIVAELPLLGSKLRVQGDGDEAPHTLGCALGPCAIPRAPRQQCEATQISTSVFFECACLMSAGARAR